MGDATEYSNVGDRPTEGLFRYPSFGIAMNDGNIASRAVWIPKAITSKEMKKIGLITLCTHLACKIRKHERADDRVEILVSFRYV